MSLPAPCTKGKGREKNERVRGRMHTTTVLFSRAHDTERRQCKGQSALAVQRQTVGLRLRRFEILQHVHTQSVVHLNTQDGGQHPCHQRPLTDCTVSPLGWSS